MSAISSAIFRAYDIRGVVGKALTPEVVEALGRAIGSEALDLGENCLIAGADDRLSSPRFHRALVKGILATGCKVIDIGVVPTPLLYFATHVLECGSGVMVTGSHNPKDYNGVKIVLRRQCLANQQIQNLRRRLQAGDLREGSGSLRQEQVEDAYVRRVTSDVRLSRKFKVVLDCGNGVTGRIAPRLFEALDCQVIPLFCEPDGNFPHHHPDPTRAENLRDLIREVKAEGADLGIAFDGDGDRLGLVSNTGEIIDADKMLMAFAADILPANPGAAVVFDVKSSFQLPRLIEAAGGRPIICKSGHSFVKRKVQESGALLGGEFSAHIFFGHRWYGFDDGIYAAARFLELMDRRSLSSQALLDELPPSHGSPELFLPVDEEEKFELMALLQDGMRLPGATLNVLDGLRADFPEGWGLVRASNTTPALTLRFEAETLQELARIQDSFRREILRLAPALEERFPEFRAD